ncbi:MAG TPA: hypothetical protein VG711_11325 [Phycisphaerales bacterium]|nr:hypothetical protein [Phycisphaerales bacterium]
MIGALIGGAVGAIVGALVWAGITYATNYEIKQMTQRTILANDEAST